MSEAARMPTMPRTIGERPVHPLAMLALVLGLLLTTWATTEIIAYRLGFSSSLGAPLIGIVDEPWAWLRWLWKACNPITRINPLTHLAPHVPTGYEALPMIPRTIGTAALASVPAS